MSIWTSMSVFILAATCLATSVAANQNEALRSLTKMLYDQQFMLTAVFFRLAFLAACIMWCYDSCNVSERVRVASVEDTASRHTCWSCDCARFAAAFPSPSLCMSVVSESVNTKTKKNRKMTCCIESVYVEKSSGIFSWNTVWRCGADMERQDRLAEYQYNDAVEFVMGRKSILRKIFCYLWGNISQFCNTSVFFASHILTFTELRYKPFILIESDSHFTEICGVYNLTNSIFVVHLGKRSNRIAVILWVLYFLWSMEMGLYSTLL